MDRRRKFVDMYIQIGYDKMLENEMQRRAAKWTKNMILMKRTM